MKVRCTKDGEWFLAEIDWTDYLFAYWKTQQEAKKELVAVIDMVMDLHLEQLETERKARNKLLETKNQINAV